MKDFYERHTIGIHLTVMGLGALAFLVALLSGDWRPLLISAFAAWFTVRA